MPQPSPERISQVASVPVVLTTGGVLAVARWLTPSVAGHGTHQQLGLSPCTFLSFTGYPCPMCGMTTCFSHMAHAEPVSAFWAQPFGLVLFAMTVFAFAVSLAEVLQPRNRWERLLDLLTPVEGRAVTIFLVGMALGWTYKIVAMGA